jgi:transposase-like protein
MPLLSSVHQRFSAEQCQACIHSGGKIAHCNVLVATATTSILGTRTTPGCKRSWCNGCKRTCNDLTNTLLHQSKRPLLPWILATFLLCLTCSSRRIAREAGGHIRTSYRWCWWLHNAALSYPAELSSEVRTPRWKTS